MKTKNILFENCKELIELYLEKNTFPFPREIKIAKELLLIWPDIQFWKQNTLNYKISSLCAFLTTKSKIELDKQYNLYLLTKPAQTINLESEPVIKIENTENKERKLTLQEFVDSQYSCEIEEMLSQI